MSDGGCAGSVEQSGGCYVSLCLFDLIGRADVQMGDTMIVTNSCRDSHGQLSFAREVS